MTWKWPNANNLTYYQKEVANFPVKVDTPLFTVREVESHCIERYCFNYEVQGTAICSGEIQFTLYLVHKYGSVFIGAFKDLPMAYKVAEIHATQNFVNPQLSH